MKNDQKNPIYPSVPFSCMIEQLIATVQDKSNKWHLNNHMWSLNLNLGFKPTTLNCVATCIRPNHIILPCHDHASYCCIALIVFILCCRWLFPPQQTYVPTMSSMTPMKSYIIFRSARQAKTPCSFRYNPILSLLVSFTALGQQRFNCYMLRQLNPFPLHDLSLPK